jgi:spermidine/putrescine-binding protein
MRLAVLVSLLGLVNGPAFGQAQVNVYNWSDYIAEDQLKVFTRETGIKVNYTTYDSNEILDAEAQDRPVGLRRRGADGLAVLRAPARSRSSTSRSIAPAQSTGATSIHDHDLNSPYDPGNAYAIPWMLGAPSASATTWPRSGGAWSTRRSITSA